MIRNFGNGTFPEYGLDEVLKHFDVYYNDYDVLRFEVITPDSFMWRLLIDGTVYYLYAEDYIPSLEHVRQVFNSYLQTEHWEFVKASQPHEWDQAMPVTHATAYAEPADSGEIMKYAIESKYDFAFLAKSSENPADASFSDHAPGGYTQHQKTT